MDETFDKLKEALAGISPADFKWKEEYPGYDIGLSESTDSIADTIDISSIGSLTTAQLPSFTMSNSPYANVTVNSAGSAGSYLYSNGSSSSWANVTLGSTTQPSSSLQVKGDAEFEGKVKINGQDLAEFMDTISKRLTILVPDPEKLEHFEALKKAYEHYKTLEALCQVPKKDGE
jgi:hypothetical protein